MFQCEEVPSERDVYAVILPLNKDLESERSSIPLHRSLFSVARPEDVKSGRDMSLLLQVFSPSYERPAWADPEEWLTEFVVSSVSSDYDRIVTSG